MTRIAALLLTITLLGTAAGAGDLETCESGKDDRKGIAACTRLLDAGVHTFEERASTFVNRGVRLGSLLGSLKPGRDQEAAEIHGVQGPLQGADQRPV